MRYMRLLAALAVLSIVLAPALATSATCTGGAKCSSSESNIANCDGTCPGCSCSSSSDSVQSFACPGSSNTYRDPSSSSAIATLGRSTVGFRGGVVAGNRITGSCSGCCS